VFDVWAKIVQPSETTTFATPFQTYTMHTAKRNQHSNIKKFGFWKDKGELRTKYITTVTKKNFDFFLVDEN